MPAQVERVYTLQDTPSTHRATDGLQFSLAHTRWESVFQLTSAASVNLSEAWWKTVRSPAHAGRRFGNWEEIGEAIAKATASWNAHC
jgi:hypothetical protein